jgi:hypothetical protein
MIRNLRFAGRTPINIIVLIVAVVPPALAFASRTHLYHIAVGATVDAVHTLH